MPVSYTHLDVYKRQTSEIKKWNKLKKSSVARGQSLKIYVQVKEPAVKAKMPKEVPVIQNVASNSETQEKEKTTAEVDTCLLYTSRCV